MEQIFHIGVKAFVMNDRKEILVLLANPMCYATAHWDLPGGRIKEDNSIEETLRKEIKEELNVPEIEILNLFDVSMANFTIPVKGRKVGLLLLTYLCNLDASAKITLSSEHTEYKWSRIEEAKKLLSTKFSRTFIEKISKL